MHNTWNLRFGVEKSATTSSPIIHVIIVYNFYSLKFHSFSITHCIASIIINKWQVVFTTIYLNDFVLTASRRSILNSLLLFTGRPMVGTFGGRQLEGNKKNFFTECVTQGKLKHWLTARLNANLRCTVCMLVGLRCMFFFKEFCVKLSCIVFGMSILATNTNVSPT